jgi:membrane fusion protein, multidrug efflux system
MDRTPPSKAEESGHDHRAEPVHPEATRPVRRRRNWLLAGAAGVIAAAVVVWGVTDRQNTLSQLAHLSQQRALPKVALVSPQPGPSTRELTFPGDVEPWFLARIYAQVSGYVTAWYKDFGAPVRKGEVLATIDTPDLDQQLQQARAQLQVAEQRYALAKLTAQRWQKLAGTAAVSQETVDVNAANARAEEATVQAAKFNVERYESQEAFKQVVAPFDGVVTARYTDIGNYVEATGGTAGNRGLSRQLFTVADIDKLRVYVSLPQDYSGNLEPGLTATMTLPQFPGQTFDVKLATTAQAFNLTSRTVLVELTADNPQHRIWPGAFAEVHFKLPIHPGVLVVPQQSLLFRAQGLQVALVKDGKVHLQNVTLGVNLGQQVQVTEGLAPSDRLIANPSQGLLDGQAVQVVDAPPQNVGLSDRVSGSGHQASDQ